MRKAFFWTHLAAGLLAGGIILLMCVTGVLLTWERQTIEWAERGARSSADCAASPEKLVAGMRAAGLPAPASLLFRSAPAAPVEASLPRNRVVLVDACSGRVVAEASPLRAFFRSVTSWHRWLAMEGPQRATGRAITGACNLAFLGLALSGMYLWLPRRWSWPTVRAVLLFRPGLAGKSRDFNWHNVIGIWSAVPLVFIVLGSAVISYPWATNLVYALTASVPPAPRPPASRGGDYSGLDAAFTSAAQRVPQWQTINVRPAAGTAFELTVAESHRGRPDLRQTLTIDRATGEIVSAERFSDFNRGRRVRAWLRFIHTGEALGWPGQTVAGLATAGGAVLVYTGIALALRRLLAWRERRRRNATLTAA